jgi:hypothetical protein
MLFIQLFSAIIKCPFLLLFSCFPSVRCQRRRPEKNWHEKHNSWLWHSWTNERPIFHRQSQIQNSSFYWRTQDIQRIRYTFFLLAFDFFLNHFFYLDKILTSTARSENASSTVAVISTFDPRIKIILTLEVYIPYWKTKKQSNKI